jgi:hypothetical protein
MNTKSAAARQTNDDRNIESSEADLTEQPNSRATQTDTAELAANNESAKQPAITPIDKGSEPASNEPDAKPPGFAPGVEKRDPAAAFKGENRRAHQRSHVVLPYTMAYEDPYNPQARCQGYTEDLSVGGVSIYASVNIPLGSPVAIRLEVVMYGMHTHIVATGKIANHAFSSKGGGFRYGIQFISVRDEYKKTIQKLHQAIAKRML